VLTTHCGRGERDYSIAMFRLGLLLLCMCAGGAIALMIQWAISAPDEVAIGLMTFFAWGFYDLIKPHLGESAD
jgi:hypothetical protein